MRFARRDHSSVTGPPGNKTLVRQGGLPANKVFPLIRLPWIWPAPGHHIPSTPANRRGHVDRWLFWLKRLQAGKLVPTQVSAILFSILSFMFEIQFLDIRSTQLIKTYIVKYCVFIIMRKTNLQIWKKQN